jgi:hypothetical protein
MNNTPRPRKTSRNLKWLDHRLPSVRINHIVPAPPVLHQTAQSTRGECEARGPGAHINESALKVFHRPNCAQYNAVNPATMVHVPVHTLRALNTATMLMPFRSVISLRAAVQSAILGDQNDKGIDSALLLDVTLCGL